jgi:hypothetical protein
MDEIKYSFKQTGQLAIREIKPNYNISFHNNGKEVGKLDFNGSALVFTGEAEESAKVFIDWIARNFAGRLEEERKAEREALIEITQALLRDDPFDATASAIQLAIRARGNT